MKKLLLIIFLILGLFSFSEAATYYIKNGGSDVADGLSDANAWATINKVNTSSFIAGDSILFKKGSTWREQLTVPSSGSSGNPITFGSYGSGANSVISGADLISTWTAESANLYYATYLTVPNTLTYDRNWGVKKTNKTDMSVTGDWWVDVPNTRIYLYTTAGDPDNVYTTPGVEAGVRNKVLDGTSRSYITYQNLTFLHANSVSAEMASIKSNLSGIIVDSCTFQFGAQNGVFFNANSSLVKDSTFSYNGALGIDVDSCDNSTVQDSEMSYNGKGGVYIGALTPTADNNILQRLTIHHNSDSGIKIDNSIGSIVQDSSSYSNTSNGLRYSNSTGAIFRRNKLYSNTANGIWVYSATATGNIYYNLIYSNGDAGIVVALGAPAINVFNNVMYNNTNAGLYIDDANTIVTTKNNIISTSTALINIVSDVDQIQVLDNNLYYPTTGTPFNWKGTVKNFTDWKTASGQDALSLNTDPLLVNPTTDFHLQSSSPAINTGTSVGLTQDYTSRPIQLTPDMGAYEYEIRRKEFR